MSTTQSGSPAGRACAGDDAAAAASGAASGKKTRSRSKLRRRISGLLALAVALVSAGALYSALVPTPQTAQAVGDSPLVRQGEEVFNNTCITCHGANLQGVKDRGPSLVGVGSAAVYFQTETGRMPLARQEAQAASKPPELSEDEIQAVAAYIQATGGGPMKPEESNEQLASGDSARGGQLFRLNCASCHNYTGRGGALSSGKYAPKLDDVTPRVIYSAMLSGPQNMPKFSERQLTDQEKKDIIAYLKSVTNGQNSPGGLALGGVGPVSEGLVAWIVGITLLIGVTLWIGAKT